MNEGKNITFMCSADNITESTNLIEMYLFKNGERVQKKAIEARRRDKTPFPLTNLTVEHSGLYMFLL